MKKSELIERAARRAAERYQIDFDRALFDDLLKDGLIPNSKRGRNDGRRPKYDYDCRSYRRALQIVRFRHLGIKDRNAIRIFLFLRGYSLPVWDVREALLSVYAHSASALLATVRSTYADNKNLVPPKRKESLRRELGNVDTAFQNNGLVLSDDMLINALRSAKQDVLSLDVQSFGPNEAGDISSDKEPYSKSLIEFVSGLLLLEDEESGRPPNIDSVEALIRTGGDNSYLAARDAYRLFLRYGLAMSFELLMPTMAVELRDRELRSLVGRMENDSRWVSLIFVLALRLLVKSDGSPDPISKNASAPG